MMSSQPYQVMPSLSQEEFQSLKASIGETGVMVPVEVDEDGNILDGHHRVQACEELGIAQWPQLVRSGMDENEKRAHARQLNLSRRHLNAKQKRTLIAEQIVETPSISSNAIAARLGVSDKTVSSVREQLISRSEIPNVEFIEDTRGRKQPARKAPVYIDNTPDGRSATVARAKEIRTENKAASREKRISNLNQIADKGRVVAGTMPVAAFPILYGDPAWENEVWGEETGSDKNPPYPTMSVEEICQLCAGDKSPATKDAVLYLWRKANNVEQALQVIHAWGFKTVSEMIWDKVLIGNGRWVRDRHEVLMICRRGDIPAPVMGEQPASLHSEKRGQHSSKPAWFAEQITTQYPDLPKLELFQRRQSLTKGDVRLKRDSKWKFWGFESGGEK